MTSDRVLADLRALIASGELRSGSRLPPERQLAERLRVNRGTVRKALARLELEGAVSRHVGRGTFVGAPPAAAAAIAGSASPMELMDARLSLEPVIAREAALRARKDDLARLRLCVRRFGEEEEFAGFEEWDVAFHRAVAEATQNPIFLTVMEVLRGMRSTEEWERLKRASFGAPLRRRYRAEHQAILAALEMRDPAAAAAAMVRHMQTVRMAVSGSWPEGSAAGELSAGLAL